MTIMPSAVDSHSRSRRVNCERAVAASLSGPRLSILQSLFTSPVKWSICESPGTSMGEGQFRNWTDLAESGEQHARSSIYCLDTVSSLFPIFSLLLLDEIALGHCGVEMYFRVTWGQSKRKVVWDFYFYFILFICLFLIGVWSFYSLSPLFR